MDLNAAWASGLSTPQLQFQDSKTVVGVAGQHLKFVPCSMLTAAEALQLYPGKDSTELRHGIALLATCPKASLYAYTEPALKPGIHLCSYPDMTVVAYLEADEENAVIGYSALAFSRSGNRLATLSEQPEPVLMIWTVDSRDILITSKISMPYTNICFNPADANALCT